MKNNIIMAMSVTFGLLAGSGSFATIKDDLLNSDCQCNLSNDEQPESCKREVRTLMSENPGTTPASLKEQYCR